MTSLKYVGKTPASDRDIDRRLETNTQLNSGMSRGYVDGRAVTLAGTKATKTYVDTQDGTYQLISYYQTQDALNIPNSSKGVANGVATLDSTGKIPSAQVPVLGAGVVKGPYGPTSVASGTLTTGSTPLLIASWNIGAQAVNCRVLAFMLVSVTTSSNGRPVIEIRSGDNTQTTYASQTMVAQGYGRSYYNDYQTITVQPTPNTTNVMQDGVQTYIGAATNLQLTAWLYDDNAHTVSTTSGLIATASAYLLRVAT